MKCSNCGCTFDAADVAHVREDYGETHWACPMCGADDLEETEPCLFCFRERTEDELASGFCINCLSNAIDYDTALRYLKDSGALTEFMLGMVFQAGVLDRSSNEFDALMESVFMGMADKERSFRSNNCKSGDLLEKCRDFILPNYPEIRSEEADFADWFKEKLEEC